jgi:hypothetical protein
LRLVSPENRPLHLLDDALPKLRVASKLSLQYLAKFGRSLLEEDALVTQLDHLFLLFDSLT